MRTCFKRELNKQKECNGTPWARKRRKYIYFDQLSFLLSILEDSADTTIPNETNNTSPPFLPFQEKLEIDDYDEFKEEYEDIPLTEEESQIPEPPRLPQEEKTAPHCETPQMNIFQNIKTNEVDEDVLFLLSLLPSFKRLNEDQKIDAKVEFLNVLRRVRNHSLSSNLSYTPAQKL